MTEVPEYLLERSKARRAALGLGGGGDDSASAAAGGVAPVTSSAAPTVPAAAATVAVEKAPPPPPPAYVQAGIDRKRIPWWAMPVLGLLPFWAVLYAGTLSPAAGGPTPLDHGGEIYATACASCHGATGGGGSGPQLAGGAVLETFPDRADHLAWVFLGSVGWPNDTYGAQAKPVTSGMPPHAGLSPEELLLVVRYEREVLSHESDVIDDSDTEAIDEEGNLLVTDPETGELVDALEYYFGEAAHAAAVPTEDGLPAIAGTTQLP